jgi:hypothetical protein
VPNENLELWDGKQGDEWIGQVRRYTPLLDSLKICSNLIIDEKQELDHSPILMPVFFILMSRWTQ